MPIALAPSFSVRSPSMTVLPTTRVGSDATSSTSTTMMVGSFGVAHPAPSPFLLIDTFGNMVKVILWVNVQAGTGSRWIRLWLGDYSVSPSSLASAVPSPPLYQFPLYFKGSEITAADGSYPSGTRANTASAIRNPTERANSPKIFTL